jgi:sec-independent protein translocase protein TatA
MGSFSVWHWLIVLLVVMLVFGTKKIGNIGGDLGKAVRKIQTMPRAQSWPDTRNGPTVNLEAKAKHMPGCSAFGKDS